MRGNEQRLKGGLDAASGIRPTRVRHIVLWMTVAAYMVTYMDRVVISVAAPSIQEEFGFSVITMGWIFASFQIAYALFQVPGGWLGDRFGPRRALTGIVVWWSTFTAVTALTWSAASMIVARFLFGMGEAGAFPNATRSLSRWMLPGERGWAQGLTHAGARLGGAITPIFVAFLILSFGWRMPFFIFAVVGLVWAAGWFWYYRDTPREHRSVNEAERDMLEAALGTSSMVKRSVPWRQLLTNPQMWLLSIARRSVAIVGFVTAGITIPFAVTADDPLVSVAYFAFAVFALELTVGVSWAVTLDIGGEFAGSVSAIMNTCGNIGGALAGVLTGYIVAESGWEPAFYVLSGLTLFAALIFLRIDASKPLYSVQTTSA